MDQDFIVPMNGCPATKARRGEQNGEKIATKLLDYLDYSIHNDLVQAETMVKV